jgi:hypothetical protein
MPSGWFSVIDKNENGKKIEKHYCMQHYNEIMREKRRKEAEEIKQEASHERD